MPSPTDASVQVRAARSWPKEPYKGLSFFAAPDAPLFTQREEEVEDCAARIDDFSTRVLLLHGFSGTGKSSFLRAGLVPRLREPPEHGCTFLILQDHTGEPILVRGTADPVAKIHATLTDAVRSDGRIPALVRAEVQNILIKPLASDRREAADTVLAALRALTAGLRDIFILLIDQAEEVLTLPRQDENASNRRAGFFYLLEELCHQRLDMRAIVAFRTEYYGQFCSFFRIPPTLRITSAALPRAGLVDYLLRPIDDVDRITAAIRRPTLMNPVDDLPAPYETYNFTYAPGVAEQIAHDLVTHAGDGSALPIMQVVCKDLFEHVCRKDGRPIITADDYERMGCVQGALDLHIHHAIRSALLNAGNNPVSEIDVDRWRLTLCHLVGKQEGSAVTSLIAREDQLIAVAAAHGVGGNACTVLRELAQSPSRILRQVKQPGYDGRTYSLGHDCLGPALWRWSERHAERLQADAEAERRLARQEEAARLCLEGERRGAETRLERQRREGRLKAALAVATVMVIGAGSLALLQETYLPRRQAVSVLNSVAIHQGSSHLRQRILLLLTSLQKTETWPWSSIIGSDVAREELKETLLRSPVFGGSFVAGLAPTDDKLSFVEYDRANPQEGRLSIRDLATGALEVKPLHLPLGNVLSARMPRPPSVGFVSLASTASAHTGQAVVIAGADPAHLLALADGTLQSAFATVPTGFLENAVFPPAAEFGAGTLRFVKWNTKQGLVDRITVVPTNGSAGTGIEFIGRKAYDIDWQPEERSARRMPVFADDCDAFAFMGRREKQQAVEQTLWFGRFDGQAEPHAISAHLAQGDQALSSVAITRGCNAVLVRVPDQLIALDLQGRQDLQQAVEHAFKTPEAMSGFVLSSFPLAAPPLASAPLTGNRGWRTAWMIEEGVAVADVHIGSPNAEALQRDKETDAPLPFLTGLEATVNVSRLTISKHGDFLMIAQQRNFAAKPEVRVFDLRLDLHRQRLEAADLKEEACRVAELLGGSEFKREDLGAWAGTEELPHPCRP